MKFTSRRTQTSRIFRVTFTPRPYQTKNKIFEGVQICYRAGYLTCTNHNATPAFVNGHSLGPNKTQRWLVPRTTRGYLPVYLQIQVDAPALQDLGPARP